MARTKGVGFLHIQAFVVEHYGSATWAEVLSRFPAVEQRMLESIVSVAWYDLGLYARLLRIVEEQLAKGDPKFLYGLGPYQAERDLRSITRWLLRLFKPSVAIQQIGRYWRRFHDTGRWTIMQRDSRMIIARLDGWGVIDGALCRELTGYLGRTIEIIGAREVSVEHTRCRCRNDTSCEFRAHYRLKRDVPAEAMDAEDSPGSAQATESARSSRTMTGALPSTPPPRSHTTRISTVPPPSRWGEKA